MRINFINRLFTGMLAIISVVSCDPNHQNEFYSIDRNDVEGYQEFIRKYPSSAFVTDAQERINTALEEREMNKRLEREAAAQRQLESQYGDYSLDNGSAPYTQWYGDNLYFDNYTPHSEINVKAPGNSDVIVIVRYNNMNGSVAGHKYICAGCSATIYLENGHNYQTFFYYGKGWYPEKEMNNVKGGFLKGESFSKDGSASYLDNNVLSYELTLQENGNFQTASSSEGEMF